MKVCVIIPVYNHEGAIRQVSAQLKTYQLPVILVNDGSSQVCSQVLSECAGQEPDRLTLLAYPDNRGKGAAVMTGMDHALRLGFTHALLLDADGQHDTDDINKFLEQGRNNPDALILGKPIFNLDAPKSRVYGRLLTNLWIWINTLSLAIGDGMCGFRLYPLAAVDKLRQNVSLSAGMDFDIEIAVRLYWQGLSIINIETKVSYPQDGVSHFKMLRDNLLISKQHASLFFGMLIRLWPLLLRQIGS